MRRLVPRLGALAVGAAVLLTACASQINGLAPVGGDSITGLRIAAVDVLVENKLEIRDAPVCSASAGGYTCLGSLIDGSVVTVTSPDAKATTMTVTAGDTTIYDGPVQDVLNRAAGIK